jgi:hypothetical protein
MSEPNRTRAERRNGHEGTVGDPAVPVITRGTHESDESWDARVAAWKSEPPPLDTGKWERTEFPHGSPEWSISGLRSEYDWDSEGCSATYSADHGLHIASGIESQHGVFGFTADEARALARIIESTEGKT